MKFECCGCKKSFSGTGLIVASHGEEKVYCADCLWKLRKEYDTKKNCEDCGHFDEEKCVKTQAALAPVKVGFNTYYVEAETCKDYSTEKKTNPDKGQTLTYYCCHCGAQLKIGARAPEIQQNCPRCKGDLEIINLSKFIKQHQS